MAAIQENRSDRVAESWLERPQPDALNHPSFCSARPHPPVICGFCIPDAVTGSNGAGQLFLPHSLLRMRRPAQREISRPLSLTRPVLHLQSAHPPKVLLIIRNHRQPPPPRHFERSRPTSSSAFAPANASACAERNLSSSFLNPPSSAPSIRSPAGTPARYSSPPSTPATPSFRTQQADFFFAFAPANASACAERNLSSLSSPTFKPSNVLTFQRSLATALHSRRGWALTTEGTQKQNRWSKIFCCRAI